LPRDDASGVAFEGQRFDAFGELCNDADVFGRFGASVRDLEFIDDPCADWGWSLRFFDHKFQIGDGFDDCRDIRTESDVLIGSGLEGQGVVTGSVHFASDREGELGSRIELRDRPAEFVGLASDTFGKFDQFDSVGDCDGASQVCGGDSAGVFDHEFIIRFRALDEFLGAEPRRFDFDFLDLDIDALALLEFT
jgi:hypothetical protein